MRRKGDASRGRITLIFARNEWSVETEDSYAESGNGNLNTSDNCWQLGWNFFNCKVRFQIPSPRNGGTVRQITNYGLLAKYDSHRATLSVGYDVSDAIRVGDDVLICGNAIWELNHRNQSHAVVGLDRAPPNYSECFD
jgi:hypothetical protein